MWLLNKLIKVVFVFIHVLFTSGNKAVNKSRFCFYTDTFTNNVSV